MIGGSLSRPADQFPHLFGHSDFLRKYPYFLPCAVPATFAAFALIVTFFFLKESVPSPKSIATLFRFRTSKANLVLQNVVEGDDPTVTYDVPSKPEEKPYPLRDLLTRDVIIAGGNYALLSLVDISYRGVQPIFYSTPVELGGLGLTPSQIGTVRTFSLRVNMCLLIAFVDPRHQWCDWWTFPNLLLCEDQRCVGIQEHSKRSKILRLFSILTESL